MKTLADFATTPKLTAIVLDSPEVLEITQEPIQFWIQDQVPLAVYFSWFSAQAEAASGELDKIGSLEKIFSQLVLKEDGTPMLKDGQGFPHKIRVAAMGKISDFLGK